MSDISGGSDWWMAGNQTPNPTNATAPLQPEKHPRSRRALIFGILAVVFFVAALGGGYVAFHQNKVAGQWRSRDRAEVVRDQGLTKNLATANASISSLNGNVSTLTSRVGSLRTQLSAVANAKEKALDENAVLTQLNGEAETVSQQLSTCVDDMQSLIGEISTDLEDNDFDDPELQPTAETANDDCTTAQQDNDQLQATLNGAG